MMYGLVTTGAPTTAWSTHIITMNMMLSYSGTGHSPKWERKTFLPCSNLSSTQFKKMWRTLTSSTRTRSCISGTTRVLHSCSMDFHISRILSTRITCVVQSCSPPAPRWTFWVASKDINTTASWSIRLTWLACTVCMVLTGSNSNQMSVRIWVDSGVIRTLYGPRSPSLHVP